MVSQLTSASDQLLSHWTRSSKLSEDFLEQTKGFLEDLKTLWIPDHEFQSLNQSLRRGEVDLVYRYLELQLALRSSDDPHQLRISSKLEKELDNYLANNSNNALKRELALRSMEQVVNNWLVSIGFSRPPIISELNENNFGHEIYHSLSAAKKERGFKFSPNASILLEAFLEKNDTSLEYWNRACASLEQILLWEETLSDLLKSLQIPLSTPSTDRENLEIRLNFFEKELMLFYKQLGKNLSENILTPFSEVARASILGNFKKLFQHINDTYNHLKSTFLNCEIDLHLCCSCHYCLEQTSVWNEKKRLINLSTIPPFHSAARTYAQSVLVFTCGGGRGHLSVAKAISEYARGKYHVHVANTLEETLASTDVFKRMLFNFSQERLYNHLLRNEEFEWIKLLTSLGPFFLMMQQESIEKQIRLEILKHNPDLLVSCFPCLNAMFLNVAKELDLPLIMVTTDLNTAIFAKGMHERSCDLSYPKWRMTLAYDTPEMRAITEKRIPSSKIRVTGFPSRIAFNQPVCDLEQGGMRQHFKIQPNDRVLLVMIGGMAGRATEKYASILAQLTKEDISQLTKENLHIICLCGDQSLRDNREMRLRISALQPETSHLKIHAIGAIEDIASLMHIADGIITRPSGCTTNEALAVGLPMIFHAPFALMEWEIFNMEFCIEVNMGSRFKLQVHSGNLNKNKERLLPLIKKAFERRQEITKPLFTQKNFGKEFLKLAEELVQIRF